jgi:uncharacterized protein YxeA
MKRVVTTITAVIFALGLAGGALAQTAKTPEKPGVKTETSASPATVAPQEAAQPEKTAVKESAKPGAKAEAKATEKCQTKKEAKKVAKKEAKKGKEVKKSAAPVEPSLPEKK